MMLYLQVRLPELRPGTAGLYWHEVRPAGGQGGRDGHDEEVQLQARHQDYRASGDELGATNSIS